MTARASATSSKQITDYVLCADCEDLFNKNGETWMMKQVWNGKCFPLRDRLDLALPLYGLDDSLAFSGVAAGIDTNKLGYFALSVIWRGAVHQWKLQSKTTVLNLGTSEEPVRQFLHGDAPFPSDVVIIATVCGDRYSWGVFYTPKRTGGISGPPWFDMLVLGVHLTVFVGDSLPPLLRERCCVKSAHKLIFQSDCSREAMRAFAQLMGQRPVPLVRNII